MTRTLKYDSTEQLTRHINAREVRCKCGGTHDTIIDMQLLETIENVIDDIASFEGVSSDDVKIYISSGYRCRQHDINVGGNGSGTHTTGNALDFEIIVNHRVYDNKIIAALMQEHGFTGIGRIDNSYIHGDNAPISAHGGIKWLGDETVPGGTSGSIIKESDTYWRYYNIKRPACSDTLDMCITIEGRTYKGTLTRSE